MVDRGGVEPHETRYLQGASVTRHPARLRQQDLNLQLSPYERGILPIELFLNKMVSPGGYDPPVPRFQNGNVANYTTGQWNSICGFSSYLPARFIIHRHRRLNPHWVSESMATIPKFFYTGFKRPSETSSFSVSRLILKLVRSAK